MWSYTGKIDFLGEATRKCYCIKTKGKKQKKKAFRGKWIVIIILVIVKWTDPAIFIPRDPKVCCQIVYTEMCHFSGAPLPVEEGHMGAKCAWKQRLQGQIERHGIATWSRIQQWCSIPGWEGWRLLMALNGRKESSSSFSSPGSLSNLIWSNQLCFLHSCHSSVWDGKWSCRQ